MRIALFLPNWIGDVVMATPAIRALRKMLGDEGELIGVMRPYVAEVLAGTPWLDEQILYKPDVKQGEYAGRTAIARLRAARPDVAVLLTNSLRTGWMAWRSGAGTRIGTARNLRRLLINKRVAEDHSPTIDSYLRVAYAAGSGIEMPQLELATTVEDEAAADSVWRVLDLPVNNRVVVMNSGGAYGAAKHWPAEHFAAVAQRLAHEQNLHVLVNCGPQERDIARTIVKLAGDRRVVSLADFDVPLGLTKACIRRARLLLTTDSGPRFFGLAFGRPVISLFGPTSPEHTETHDPNETALTLNLDCQPCMARTCPLGHHACMRDLSVDHVYATIDEALRRTQTSAA
ncbi:lipopolysaccharide heptosyltransferase II [Aeoliella mucimassa]|uniref:lipopolysaccharide heptosyltransferase II n=1 Tax=Aeoliella mucimassa TaxID=2527972 RepID=A0A518AJQ3_9BACT|nr:lipopolysaccharide heptosyltransferase II [Aeoliella mucimassa]QDU54953.1 ADP-heptose--LPS heptosyltransferase 2 [Aeoliella mucimassa]